MTGDAGRAWWTVRGPRRRPPPHLPAISDGRQFSWCSSPWEHPTVLYASPAAIAGTNRLAEPPMPRTLDRPIGIIDARSVIRPHRGGGRDRPAPDSFVLAREGDRRPLAKEYHGGSSTPGKSPPTCRSLLPPLLPICRSPPRSPLPVSPSLAHRTAGAEQFPPTGITMSLCPGRRGRGSTHMRPGDSGPISANDMRDG